MAFNQYTRRNKYGAKKCEYNGYIYDSRKEADYAIELDIRVKDKDDPLESWDRQISFRFYLVKSPAGWLLEVNPPAKTGNIRLERYVLDFIEHNKDGSEVYTEVKGFVTTTWRRKWRLLEAFYGNDPNILLQVIK